MTFIEPNKQKFRINLFAAFFAALFLAEAVFSIITYSQSVSLEHLIAKQQEAVEEIRTKNASLKNQVYSLLDLGDADLLVSKLGLVKERRPDYLARN